MAVKTPQRTCISCRQVRDKRSLVRLVRTPQGMIEIDVTGKKEGRGAYLCHSRVCWDKILKGKQLERALKGSLTPADREKLIKNGNDLFKELSGS